MRNAKHKKKVLNEIYGTNMHPEKSSIVWAGLALFVVGPEKAAWTRTRVKERAFHSSTAADRRRCTERAFIGGMTARDVLGHSPELKPPWPSLLYPLMPPDS